MLASSALNRLDAGCEVLRNSDTLGQCSALATLGTLQLRPRVSELRSPSHPASNLYTVLQGRIQGGGGGGGGGGWGGQGFVGQGRQDSLASQTLPAREGLACETAPRSGPLALTCKSRCHPR